MNKVLKNPPITRVASGTMTGTIKFLHDSTVHNFQSFRVLRDVYSGMTHLVGVMRQPADYEIVLLVPGDEPPTGTYLIGSNNVTAYLFVGPSPNFIALSGEIVIQNQTQTGRITGSAKFKTHQHNNLHYEVEVIFDISRTAAGAERTS